MRGYKETFIAASLSLFSYFLEYARYYYIVELRAITGRIGVRLQGKQYWNFFNLFLLNRTISWSLHIMCGRRPHEHSYGGYAEEARERFHGFGCGSRREGFRRPFEMSPAPFVDLPPWRAFPGTAYFSPRPVWHTRRPTHYFDSAYQPQSPFHYTETPRREARSRDSREVVSKQNHPQPEFVQTYQRPHRDAERSETRYRDSRGEGSQEKHSLPEFVQTYQRPHRDVERSEPRYRDSRGEVSQQSSQKTPHASRPQYQQREEQARPRRGIRWADDVVDNEDHSSRDRLSPREPDVGPSSSQAEQGKDRESRVRKSKEVVGESDYSPSRRDTLLPSYETVMKDSDRSRRRNTLLPSYEDAVRR